MPELVWILFNGDWREAGWMPLPRSWISATYFFNKSKASNTSLNSPFYILIRKDNWSSRAKKSSLDTAYSDVPRSSLSNETTVCAPARRVGQASRPPFYVSIFSGTSLVVSKTLVVHYFTVFFFWGGGIKLYRGQLLSNLIWWKICCWLL